ncbi:MAG: MscL family protein [Clostridia bacterium]|nr:MscL family protein [Clostridia bacterium]
MKKITAEFKKFINRGNVVDMAVGVIVGSSFTAIVNAVSNNVLKPIINYLLSLLLQKDSLKELHTFLKVVYVVEDGVVTNEIDLKESIYIDWGTLLNAIINFFLIALVLFTIVKLINRFREEQKIFSQKLSEIIIDKYEREELREAGISLRDRAAVLAYFKEKKRLEQEKAERAKAEEAERIRREREENPTTEELLKEILLQLRKNSEQPK